MDGKFKCCEQCEHNHRFTAKERGKYNFGEGQICIDCYNSLIQRHNALLRNEPAAVDDAAAAAVVAVNAADEDSNELSMVSTMKHNTNEYGRA